MNEKNPVITIETVTPEIAARLLGTMKGNRALRQRAVQRYAREMIAGKWAVNGEAIKIAANGRLIDGQHRLNAVMMAKVPVRMCVVRGVDDELYTIHAGEDGAALRLSDCRRAAQLVSTRPSSLEGSSDA